MFDYMNEYPHTIEYGSIQKVGKYPNQKEGFVATGKVQGFMDTLNSFEQLQFHQMNMTVSRSLFTPYTFKFNPKKTYFKYDDKVYQCVSDLNDQGGMNEVNQTMLQVTNYGQD
ncbi:phage head-tail adapter protein (plasmid) [Staphylococcus aureus]|uniref:phage head-tail adapter protein n=1 Tax=Staphylococcus aureus TaxID=1280 RepID=UPI0021D1AE88|nr:phage head-tail adapter protein [Staphylococcus aureus]UXV54396.1 phage head-tail adapter protein [Staphylococcus aureus]UXV57108.1 phage head-tail adapter protein [Staphylococcus aureus]